MTTEENARRSGLREVTRRAVRAEVSAKALELFVSQGFDRTPVDQIAAEVGMSTRSVFRYFDTKEDMVVGDLIELGHEVAEAFRGRPARESVWTALRGALQVSVDSLENGEYGLRKATMLAETPSLRTAMLGKHLQWQQLLVPEAAGRLGGPGKTRELRAHSLVSCALACLDVAATEWTRERGNASLGNLLDTAIGAVRDGAGERTAASEG
jgi:AcrR family transcriptional regulator